MKPLQLWYPCGFARGRRHEHMREEDGDVKRPDSQQKAVLQLSALKMAGLLRCDPRRVRGLELPPRGSERRGAVGGHGAEVHGRPNGAFSNKFD